MRALLALALAAGVAAADIPRGPELPKLTTKKTVKGSCSVKLGPGVSGWVFFASYSYSWPERKGPPPSTSYSWVQLNETKAFGLSDAELYAVPGEVAKTYPTDEELTSAIRAGKFTGVQQHKHHFYAPSVEVRKWENPSPPDAAYVITAIDDAGIHVTETTVPDAPKPKGGGVFMPGGWCAGFAASVAVATGGLWLVRRKRK